VEFRQVYQPAQDRLKLYLLLIANCGFYASDIGSLRKSELDLKKGTITRQRTKTGDDFDRTKYHSASNVPDTTYVLWPETLRLGVSVVLTVLFNAVGWIVVTLGGEAILHNDANFQPTSRNGSEGEVVRIGTRLAGRSTQPLPLKGKQDWRNRSTQTSFRLLTGTTNARSVVRGSRSKSTCAGDVHTEPMAIARPTNRGGAMADDDLRDSVPCRDTMSSIRDELCRFIRLNEQDQWICSGEALEQLERFGDDLIPGLIECLEDGHPDVRHLAVKLLAAARPRSDVAVPNLIERLTDDDWLIVTSVILALGDFGPLASAAIPQIEAWLESPNEYILLLAATTIMKLDPKRTEFLPVIRDAKNSDHPVVRSFARDFFDDPLA
jgi:hypothetical protein